MWITFKYTVLSLIKERGVLIWVLIFPIVLSTLFAASFKNLEQRSFALDPVVVAVVQDAAYDDPANMAFSEMIDALDASGDNHLLDVTFVDDADEAQELLANGSVLGYYALDDEGTPSLVVSPVTGSTSMDAIDKTILANIADEFIHSRATIEYIAQNNPTALADSSIIASFYNRADYTQQISITANPSAQSIRYFYALLGFAALMAAMISLQAIIRTQPNLSPVGARRAVGSLGRGKTLAATLLASWTLSFALLVVAYCYMRFVLGISFGGRDAQCLLGILVASLMATAFGACIGAIPKLADGAKGGILTAITCFCSLFAGLYGSPSLSLADQLARTVPWLATLNPVKKVADVFYSLYFYTSLDPFYRNIAILLAFAGFFTIFAALFMRRQRYASL